MNYDDFEDRNVQTRFGMIHYKVHPGGSRKLVLLHGLSVSVRTWRRLVEYLPDGIYVCMIDLLGHGESEAPRITYTIEEQEECVTAVIKKERLSDYYLMGHSYGAWIAAAYAMEDRQIKGVILEDSAGLKEFYEEVDGADGRKAYTDSLIKEGGKLGTQEYVIRSVLDQQFTANHLTDEELEGIRYPTLIIWGEKDDVVNPKFAKIFNDSISDSQLFIVKGSGHTPHYTNAKEVSARLLEFMK
jgi:pimeloyl-ACP methyl ester carboxylesterase